MYSVVMMLLLLMLLLLLMVMIMVVVVVVMVVVVVVVVVVATVDLWGSWPNALCPWKIGRLNISHVCVLYWGFFHRLKKKLKLLMDIIKFLNIGLYFLFCEI